MPVRRDAGGRRSVQVEVEVAGTPDRVWQAIATGPGVASWFVPTTIDERQGGEIRCDFGPGSEAVARITEWQPPRRFAAVAAEPLAPNGPTLTTEWVVEPRGASTCVVRVVHTLIADSDEFDIALEQAEGGWPGFFERLKEQLQRGA